MKVQRQHSKVDYANVLAHNKRLRQSQESYVKFIETITQIYDDCFEKLNSK